MEESKGHTSFVSTASSMTCVNSVFSMFALSGFTITTCAWMCKYKLYTVFFSLGMQVTEGASKWYASNIVTSTH